MMIKCRDSAVRDTIFKLVARAIAIMIKDQNLTLIIEPIKKSNEKEKDKELSFQKLQEDNLK